MSNNEYQRPRGPHNPNSRPNQAPPTVGPRRQAPQEAQPPRSAAEPASLPRGPHFPNSRPNQAPPAAGPRRQAPQEAPPPLSAAEPASIPRGPYEFSDFRPNQNPERRGPHKQTSQPAAALTDSSNVRNGFKIKAEPLPSCASTGAGKPNRQKTIRLTEAEVAERLKISPKTLRNWRSKGKGPHYLKIEGQIRYRLVDVDVFEKKGWSGTARRVIL
jgi:hypothetical protein